MKKLENLWWPSVHAWAQWFDVATWVHRGCDERGARTLAKKWLGKS